MGDIVEKGQKQNELLDKIRRRAEAAMTTSERLELDFRCSATKKGFTVLLERKRPDRVYKVVEIAKKETASRAGTASSAAPKALDLDVNEIEYDGIKCPYCGGGRWLFIKCGCGMLSCAGGVEEYEGKYRHVCPWCGSEGHVKGEIERLSGRTVNRGEIAPSAKDKKLPPPTAGMLGQGRQQNGA